MHWKKMIDKSMERARNEYAKVKYVECTFSPEINKKIAAPTSLRECNINAMNMYIENRRSSLKEKQIQEEYKKKIFFEKPKYPHNKNKIEKEKNNEDINRKKYLNKNNLFETPTNQIKKMRQMLNINSFFDEITNYDSKNNTITNNQEDKNV